MGRAESNRVRVLTAATGANDGNNSYFLFSPCIPLYDALTTCLFAVALLDCSSTGVHNNTEILLVSFILNGMFQRALQKQQFSNISVILQNPD